MLIKGKKVDLCGATTEEKWIKALVNGNTDIEALEWTGRNDTIPSYNSCLSYVEECLADNNQRLFYIFNKSNNLIGSCTLEYLDRQHNNVELGIIVFKNGQNKGCGTETIQLLIEYAFDHMHAHRVRLLAHSENKRAIHVYNKCGFKVCGTEHETTWYKGKWVDTVYMEMLDREYYSEKEII